MANNEATKSIKICQGYRPGLLARTLQMHMDYYSRESGFGQVFESGLATGLGEFLTRLDHERNAVWFALLNENIIGTIYVDGEDLGENRAHLRAFIVSDQVRGGGVGRQLLSDAIAFVDKLGFSETHLWTFEGLDQARRLYESFGFVLKGQERGSQWGREVNEQLFIRNSTDSSAAP